MNDINILELEASILASRLVKPEFRYLDPVAESKALSARKAAQERSMQIKGEINELRKRLQA